MKIKDRPEYKTKKDLVTYPPETPVLEAVKIMSEKNFGSVIVINDDHTIAGIVTERDLMRRLLNQGLDPKKTKLSDIMSTEIRSAREDDNLLDWLRIMSNERFRHLPVVDEEGRIMNVMSQGDFVSYTWPELFDRLKENTKATLGAGYQVVMIVMALLAYVIIINAFT